ncbi:MAG: hypothetical protein DI606_11250 [Sphingobium sp.]|uniref:extracellular catalytic domain type 1 short-chain-length polyhydroxyalkanoate depolymerase n=1 Tax=Sphingobium sp. TaxID=1912891 RepID=UPI000DB4D0AC|nr:PHB depolymerase family esterase [Sphingobium sp.]PZU11319.1 MAG: hypothetical protein DI606_11250 [Sphingobium sp.]
METLSATIAKLAAMRAMGSAPAGAADNRLKDLATFGSNPGALRARIHVPPVRPANPALVVVLHGCTQTAAGYDEGSGWSRLADKYGFILLFPEQQRGNNPNLCFNWFSPADNARDRGEAMSIRQMIATVVQDYEIDPERIFVTGLSAGGAMTSILLATYPELFAGGAIIAGLPHGAASNVSQALDAMRGGGGHDGGELGNRVRAASGHSGPWPHISIWHGTADATVAQSNADAILAQWLSVHDLGSDPAMTETVGRHSRRRWTDAGGRTVIEDHRISGMGHGTPLATKGPDGCGTVMPHMLEVGISSTRSIAESWGLLGREMAQSVSNDEAATAPLDSSPNADPVTDVGKAIHDALRAAGLMR